MGCNSTLKIQHLKLRSLKQCDRAGLGGAVNGEGVTAGFGFAGSLVNADHERRRERGQTELGDFFFMGFSFRL